MTAPPHMSLGLFRSPLPFRGFSMERYADSLAAELRNLDMEWLQVSEIAPEGSKTVRAALQVGRLRRVATLAGRFPDYMLRARSSSYDVNHVLDHSYGQLAFVLDPRRTVVTCQDIFPLKVWQREIDGLPRRRLPPLSIRLSLAGMARAAAVIVASEATRRDVEALGIPNGRIFLVPHGVDERFRPHVARELDAYPLGGAEARHVLTVDTGVAYKNPRASVEVLLRVAVSTSEDVRLVRLGSALPASEWERARRYGVADRILELGVVADDDLPRIYSRCDVLLFPSFYEGFGWPVLEAMACGTPVVRSAWTSLEEIAGDASLTADARDYDALAAHVLCILEDETVAKRLSVLGRERAATFTWRRAAERTAAVYAKVAAAGTAAAATSTRVARETGS